MNKLNNNTRRIAFSGIIGALCLVCMFFTGIIPALNYTLPAIAGVLLIVIVLEFNKRTAYLCFVAVALLSFVVTPNKDATLFFVFFFGYYPILKSSLEKPKSRIIEWVLKILIFNVAIVSIFLIVTYVMGTSELLSEQEGAIKIGLPILLLAVNGAFVLYDYALTLIIPLYCKRVARFFSRK